MNAHAQFLAEVEGFLSRHGMSATRLGVDALKNPNFVFDLRSGKTSPSLKTVDRVRAFMAAFKKAAA